MNATFLVDDDELASEGLIVGRPVLEHMKIDTKTLLEANRAALEGIDCSAVGNPTMETQGVSRIMSARAEKITTLDSDLTRPRITYFSLEKNYDPFPDENLISTLSDSKQEETARAVDQMGFQAQDNVLREPHFTELRNLVLKFSDIFRTELSAGEPADFEHLQIKLTGDAKPVRVKLRNYSQDQRAFLKDFVARLVGAGMAYSNPTAALASAPLLVPKAGPARYRFTVDLRPVNKYTIRHHFPMPNVEHELVRLTGYQFFAKFDLLHGYWQLPLAVLSQYCQSFVTPCRITVPANGVRGTCGADLGVGGSVAERNRHTESGSLLAARWAR